MENLVYTYALIKSLFDKGEDYLDSFLPLVLKSLERTKFLDIRSIQVNLKKRYSLEMPLHVIATVLSRSRRRKWVEQRIKDYQLTDKGAQYVDKLETEREVNRRINALLDDLANYFELNKLTRNRDQIFGVLISFLNSNIKPLIEWINPSATASLQITRAKAEENLLVEYLKEAEKQKPNEYQTLHDLILGSIISTILYTQRSTEMMELTQKRLRDCRIFLDTNFVFAILELEPRPEVSQSARELLRLLRDSKCDVRVFDFTLDELSSVMLWYTSESHRYPTTIQIEGVCAKLKRDGWTNAKVYEFMANINDILEKQGIRVETEPDINLKTYNPKKGEMRSLIRIYKPEQALLPQNHDLAAIEKIQQFRGSSMRQIENCRALFLTMDAKLSRFDFEELGHKERGTISEVMLDRLMTNIIWLKHPSSNLPLKSIVAAHSRTLFVSRVVWRKFYETLAEMKKQGKVQDENISTLFYHGYIEEVLMDISEDEYQKVTPEFVMAQFEKSAKIIEEEAKRLGKEKEDIERTLREKEKIFVQQLNESVLEKGREKEKERLDEIMQIVSKTRNLAQSSAKKRICAARIVVALLLVGPSIGLLATRNWEALGKIGTACSIIALIVGLAVGSISRLSHRLYLKWFNGIYKRRLKDIGLEKHG